MVDGTNQLSRNPNHMKTSIIKHAPINVPLHRRRRRRGKEFSVGVGRVRTDPTDDEGDLNPVSNLKRRENAQKCNFLVSVFCSFLFIVSFFALSLQLEKHAVEV